LHINDVLKPEGVKAIMEALGDLFYKHLKDIRLWKVEALDEGVNAVCHYM